MINFSRANLLIDVCAFSSLKGAKNHALVHALEVQNRVNHSISIVSVEIFLALSSNVFAIVGNFLILTKLFRRMGSNSGSGAKTQWTGHDGGTQTQIRPGADYSNKKETERRTTGAGEVRVIVQPIQPVFYMPRQSTKDI